MGSVAGKYLSVTIDGTDYEDPMSWTVRENSESLDRTSGSTGGFNDEDGGILTADIDIQFVQDTTTGFYTEIAAGTVLTNLRLFRNSNDTNPAYLFPIARVVTSGQEVRVKGSGVMVPITARNKRTYTRYNPSTPA